MTDLKQTTYSYTISQHPKPVGYWVLYEQLLGWQWKDA
jgi:hypothetical protein